MSTATTRRNERLRHAQQVRVLRGRRRAITEAAQAMAADACPACAGYGADNGCWACGETPTHPDYWRAA